MRLLRLIPANIRAKYNHKQVVPLRSAAETVIKITYILQQYLSNYT